MQSTSHYRASLHEARDNSSGETVWICRFLNSETKLDKSQLVWFHFANRQDWFSDDDRALFRGVIASHRNAAFRFVTLADAMGFMARLRPAEIHDGAGQAAS